MFAMMPFCPARPLWVFWVADDCTFMDTPLVSLTHTYPYYDKLNAIFHVAKPPLRHEP